MSLNKQLRKSAKYDWQTTIPNLNPGLQCPLIFMLLTPPFLSSGTATCRTCSLFSTKAPLHTHAGARVLQPASPPPPPLHPPPLCACSGFLLFGSRNTALHMAAASGHDAGTTALLSISFLITLMTFFHLQPSNSSCSPSPFALCRSECEERSWSDCC
jgi:hypothetical protein